MKVTAQIKFSHDLRACLCLGIWLFLLEGGLPGAPLVTRWAAAVSPTNVWPEYPRPQFVRTNWQSLNGLWDYAITRNGSIPPAAFVGKILVPFPLESFLSGVQTNSDSANTLWYRRTFQVPESWHGQNVLLHFGAGNSVSEVFLNRERLGSHHGGYDAFSFDITSRLHGSGTNEVLIGLQHAPEGDYPFGKQVHRPRNVFYTSSSGIWQTVWLEPIPPDHLTEVHVTPNLFGQSVRILPLANSLDRQYRVEARVFAEGIEVAHAQSLPGAEIELPLAACRPWSPDSPFLYDLTLSLLRGTNELDRVRSYFGLREIRVGADEIGRPVLFLNGQPQFQLGVLDQGYWPDGLYTAPCAAAMQADLETARSMGFNLIRKHQKVEPDYWYYLADKLGLLVWQDMPRAINDTDENRQQFEQELYRMIDGLGNHPSIVTWVLFNETWGKFDLQRLTRAVKRADPSRLIISASGGDDENNGQIQSLHCLNGNCAVAANTNRPVVFGLLRGGSLAIADHTWPDKTWEDYQAVQTVDELTQQYASQLNEVWRQSVLVPLAACIYVQLYDVESECNGLTTYDRAVRKIPIETLRQINQSAPQAAPRIRVEASHVHPSDPVEAIFVHRDPASSDDQTIPRFTWWPHLGTTEWVSCAFDSVRAVSTVKIYWFDDNGNGHCRVPASWKLLYLDGDAWKPIENESPFGSKLNQFNQITFSAVQTRALRIEVQLQPNYSSGILQWRVNEE